MRMRRERRSELLHRIYKASDASVTEFVSAHDLTTSMEITPEETRKILAYLEEKGYVLVDDHRAGVVRITAEGIDAVELGKLSM
jgi:Mn-dependent DtxR family transcriptional regulator